MERKNKMSSTRQAEVRRETKETKIFLRLDLDQAGEPKISTGVGSVSYTHLTLPTILLV